MLGDTSHPVRLVFLHSLDIADSHLANQIGILAKRFIRPAPARVAGNVHDRAHGRGDAHRPRLLPDNLAHFLGQFRLPCGRHVRHGREQRASRRRIPAQVFRLERDRNPQTRLFHKILLNLIRHMGNLPGRCKSQRRKLGKTPVTVRIFFPHRLVRDFPHRRKYRQIPAKLRRLFLQRHARKQIFHANLHRLCAILVQHHKSFLLLSFFGISPVPS